MRGAALERVAGDPTREPLQTLMRLLNSRLVRPAHFRVVSRALSIRGVFERSTYRRGGGVKVFADTAVEEACWGSIYLDGETKKNRYIKWEDTSSLPLALECIRSGARDALESVIRNNPAALTADAVADYLKTCDKHPSNYGRLHTMNRTQRMTLVRRICEEKDPSVAALRYAHAALGCGVHEWGPHLLPLASLPLPPDLSRTFAIHRREEGDHPYDIYQRDMCLFHPQQVGNPEEMTAAAVRGRDRAAALLRADWERHRSPVLSYSRDGLACQAVVPAGSAERFGVQKYRGVGWWSDIEAHPFGGGEAWIVLPAKRRTVWDPMRALFGKYRVMEEEWDWRVKEEGEV